MWLPAVNLAASLDQACSLNSSPLCLVVSSIFFGRWPGDFALVQLSHFISCLPQFPLYEIRLKGFAEHPSSKRRDPSSHGGLGEGECRDGPLTGARQEVGHFQMGASHKWGNYHLPSAV